MKKPEFFYDTIADRFDELHNPYDLQRRLSIVFDVLLQQNVTGLKALDLGCGSGWFSQHLARRGVRLTSVDISPRLAKITRERSSSNAAAADAALLPFPDESFELIVSSEMIEHLRVPEKGIREISRVLCPQGLVVLTTPNRRWLWLVNLATRLKLRPYEGLENFLNFDELSELFDKYGLVIETQLGFHPWPFQITPLQKLSSRVDARFGAGPWGRWMINQAVIARKMTS